MTGPGAADADGWSFEVRDLMGRPNRDLSVRIDGREVLVTMPPPGTARLSASDVTHLTALLAAALDQLDAGSS